MEFARRSRTLYPDREAVVDGDRRLSERLAHFKTPHTFTSVAELPKTATGQIQKFVLRGNRSAIPAQ